MADDLTIFGARAAQRSERPDLRRARLDEVEVRRRLDLRSDLPLDVTHPVLQVATYWTDSRLHRFFLGGGPFGRQSHLFLCPYDVEDCDEVDDGDIPAHQVRLDETLQAPGEVMNYVYDCGDHMGAHAATRGSSSGIAGCPQCGRNREIHCAPLLDFFESLRMMRLLRKYKSRLLLTRAGAAAQRSPVRLWGHLRDRLIPTQGNDFETVAALLLLAHAATSPNAPIPREQVAPLRCRTLDGATATGGRWRGTSFTASTHSLPSGTCQTGQR